MPAIARKISRLVLALLVCTGLTSCSGIPGIYRVPVQQGNVITVEMLQELELGMNKRKVGFILGTPLVIDAFHLDRWDYFYSYQSSSGKRVQQTASLFFEQDRLTRIDANIDSKIDFHTVTKASENVLIVPPREKGGFLAAITPGFLKRDEAEAKQEAIARSLSTGVNTRQPGSGLSGSTRDALDPVLASPPAEDEVAAVAAADATAADDNATTVTAAVAAATAAREETTGTSAASAADREESASTGTTTAAVREESTSTGTTTAAAADNVSDEPIDKAAAGTGTTIDTPPKEIYAPNTSTETETAGASATSGAAGATADARPPRPVEVMSAETQGQSKYLEQLFKDFGAAPTPAPSPAAKPAQPEVPAATESQSAEPPIPTRD